MIGSVVEILEAVQFRSLVYLGIFCHFAFIIQKVIGWC